MKSKGLMVAVFVAAGAILAAASGAGAWTLRPPPEGVHAFHDNAYVPHGTMFSATLNQSLSTRRNRPGDRFTATVISPVRDAGGRVAIPAGSQLSGHVVTSTRGHGSYGSAQLSLAVDSVDVEGMSTPVLGYVAPLKPGLFRSGVPRREQAQVSQGGLIDLQLMQPLRTAELRRAHTNFGVGGGPR